MTKKKETKGGLGEWIKLGAIIGLIWAAIIFFGGAAIGGLLGGGIGLGVGAAVGGLVGAIIFLVVTIRYAIVFAIGKFISDFIGYKKEGTFWRIFQVTIIGSGVLELLSLITKQAFNPLVLVGLIIGAFISALIGSFIARIFKLKV